MTHRFALSAAVYLLTVAAAPGDLTADSMGYDQAVAALQALLNTTVAETDTHTPAKVSVLVVADEKGVLTITQRADREQPGLFFRSTSHQTWTFRAAELNPKRVAVRTEPLSVYAPIKKNARRIEVTRIEKKSRLEGGHEPAEDWDEQDAFVTSFITIPVSSIETGETVAELLRQIAKTAPDAE